MTETPDKDRAQKALKMTLAGVLGQVGWLTILVVSVAIVAGLWVDAQFQTQPVFTLVFVLASVPITLYLMFRLVLSVAPKIKITTHQAIGAQKDQEEGTEGGEHPRAENAP